MTTNACVSVSAPAAPVMVHGVIEGCHQHGGRHAAAPHRLLTLTQALRSLDEEEELRVRGTSVPEKPPPAITAVSLWTLTK